MLFFYKRCALMSANVGKNDGSKRRRLKYSSLKQSVEPRMLFDASLLAPIQDAAAAASASPNGVDPGVQASIDNTAQHSDTSASEHATPVTANNQSDSDQKTLIQDVTAAPPRTTKELVLIDARLKDVMGILDNISSDAEVHFIESDSDGIKALTNILQSQSNQYSSIHILSHGSSGAIELGSSLLTDATLNSEYSSDITSWKSHLTSDANILIYGCGVAEGQIGQKFVNNLSSILGVSVAASTDATGANLANANWTLEYQTGTITYNPQTVFSADALEKFYGVLAKPVVDLNGPTVLSITENFSSGTYTGGSSNLANTWLGGWTEFDASYNRAFTPGGSTNSDNSPISGNIVIPSVASGGTVSGLGTGSELAFLGHGAQSGDYIERSVNLKAYTYSTLSFTYRTAGLTSADAIEVDISSNSGANFITLGTLANVTTNTSMSFDISNYISTNSVIMFKVNRGFSTSSAQQFFVDNIVVSGDGNNYIGAFSEQAGTAISIVDTTMTVTDADSGQLVKTASVTLANMKSGDQFSIGTIPATITSTIDNVNGTVSLQSVSGSGASQADFVSAIKAIKFANTSATVDTTMRQINISVTDAGNETSVTASSFITITGYDNPIVANAHTVSVSSLGTTTGSLFDNTSLTTQQTAGSVYDYDPDTAGLSATLLTAPTKGTVVVNADGTYTYTPNAGATGSDSFTYTLTSQAQVIGVNYQEWNFTTTSLISNFPTGAPNSSGYLPTFNVDQAAINGANPSLDNFVVRFTNTLNINSTGSYTFYTGSDDGSVLYIDGQLVVNNDGAHSFAEKSGVISLSAGAHVIQVDFFENTGQEDLSVSYLGPDTAGLKTNISDVGTVLASTSATGTVNITIQDSGPRLALGSNVYASDTFTTRAYTNNNGTINWSGAWTEVNDGTASATSGQVLVTTGGVLQIADTSTSTSTRSISRSIDLLALSGISPTRVGYQLSFDYSTAGTNGIAVQISSNGGTSWATLDTIASAGSSSGTKTYDISNYATSNVQIRFLPTAATGISAVNFDNVKIDASTVNYTASNYIENGSAVAIASTGTVIADPAGANISSATVTISNYQTGDVLSYDNSVAGITAVFSGSTLTLSGTTSRANYALALQHVFYNSTNDNISTANRTINVTVNNATGKVSNSAVTTIGVTAVNDAPVGIAKTVSTSLNTSYILQATDFAFTDAESNSLSAVKISSVPASVGILQFDTTGSGNWTTVTTNQSITAANIASGRLRFVPTTGLSGPAQFTFQVQDTGGTANSGVDTDTTPRNFTVNVLTGPNTAPTLTRDLTLVSNVEDNFTPTPQTILQLMTDGGANAFSDPDTSASLFGLAIVGNTANASTQGVWQYSTDGTNWYGIGTVGDNSSTLALALSASSQIRFVPVADYNGTPSPLVVRAMDDTYAGSFTSGSSRITFNSGTNGGSSSVSAITRNLNTTVTAVNDAPSLISGNPILNGINATQTNYAGQSVSDFIMSAVGSNRTQVTDIDFGSVQGIAIISAAGANGTWQYSTDGGSTWTTVGSVSVNSALLLRSTDKIRFNPDGVNSGSGAITYRAWDQISGTVATKVDTSSYGGTTAFSVLTDTASISVTSASGPALANTSTPLSYIENAAAGSINTSLTLTDPNSATLSSAQISVINFVSGQDVLAFTNDGSTMGNIAGSYNSSTGIITLSSSGSTATIAQWQAALRAVKYSNSSNAPDVTTRNINYQITDTLGLPSNVLSTTVGVISVNDAPSGANKSIGVTQSSNYVFSVSDFGFSDAADSPANNFSGAIITALPSGGTLKLNGVALTVNATVSAADITAGKLVYTAQSTNGSNTIQFKVKDDGGIANSGADTAAAANSFTITVSGANTAPVLTVNSVTLPSITEDDVNNTGQTISSFLGTVTDPDSGALKGIAITTAPAPTNGTWQYSIDGGTTWSNFPAVSSSVSLLLRDVDKVRFLPNAINGGSGTFTYRAWDQTSGTAGGTASTSSTGGSTAFSTNTATASITSSAVNDAPVGTISQTSYSATEQVNLTLSGTGISVSDVDAATSNINATLTVNEGILTVAAGTTGVSISGSGTSSISLTGTVTQINNLLAGLNSGSVIYNDNRDAPAATTNLTLTVNDLGNTGSGGALNSSIVKVINITAVNDAPTFSTTGTVGGSYTENAASVPIISGTISAGDVDTTNFNGGSLTVKFTSYVAGDLFDINNQGTGAGQIGVSLSNITYGGTVIGTFTGGSASDMVITFNSNATSTVIQALAAQLRYSSTSDNPTAGGAATSRSLSLILNDGGNYGSGGNLTVSLNGTVNITAINDAPLASGSASLTADLEDTAAASVNKASITTLFSGNFSDPENNALAGVAINSYTADPSKGTWQYSTDGTAWNNISTISSASSALSLKSTDQLRFVPVANFNGSAPSLSVTLIDSTVTVTSGATINVSTAGGSTAYSSASVVLSHSVTSVNDAPVASGSASLTADAEDTAIGSLSSATITALFGSGFIDSVDQVSGGSSANTLAGIAINSYTADASKGTWQYSSDGTMWNNIGTISSASNALSLKSTDQLRFVPAANFNGAVPSLLVTLIDSSATVTSGASINVSTVGGSTAYSSASIVLSHSVTAVNDAPVASGSATLTADAEDTVAASLNAPTVLSLFNANFSDAADQVSGGSSANTLAGIAINSYTADASKGVWQYSTDGTTWNSISTISGASSALSLKSTDQLRFVPAANFNGAVPSLLVTLIDSSATVTSGASINVSTAGGSTAYSSTSVVLSHSVTSVNDAPVASGSASLAADAEDTVAASLNAPTVLSLFNANFSDAADQVSGGSSANTLAGIAINSYTADASKGVWQYSSDGTTWNSISTISGASSALSLKSTDQLRFVPAANFNGAVPSLSVTLIDSSATVTSGATVNVSTAGGSTAYSSASVVLSHSVTSVNDAPVASGSATLTADAEDTAAASVNKATITTLFGSNFSDVDNTLAGIAINSYTADASKGTWQYSTDGTNWNTISSVSGASTAFSLKSTDQLRFVPAANFNGSVPSLSVTLIDSSATVTSGATVNVSTAGGSTAYSSTSVILSHSVTSVNDAPVASGSSSLAADAEDTVAASLNAPTVLSLFNANFSDVADQVAGGSSANTLAGIAINSYTADSSKGTWQYSSDGTNWNTISSVSGASTAFSLKSTDQLRFVPAANFNGAAPSLSITLIDSSATVTSGASINVSTVGGSTAYSSASIVLSHSVTAVNDEPIASGSATLTADAEDTVAASLNAPKVLSLFNANFSDAADQVSGGSSANTLAGIAINSYTADASKGVWQYSTDGTTWNSISTISGASSALSLKSTDQLRFVPVANFNGSVPSLSVTLIDSSATVTSGAFINVSTAGGTTAYSSASVVLSHSVTSVNDAPVASGSATLTADVEDTVAASLNAPTVLSLFNANFSDAADQVSGGSSANTLAGIAINSYTADASKGTWQYSSDGTTWNSISTISGASSALSLKSTDQLRFVPAANFNGSVPSLSVTLIDSSATVTSGATVNVSTAGGSTAYSSTSVILSHSVTSVNDAPVAGGSATLSSDLEDTATGSLNAATITSLFGSNFSDVADQVSGGSNANTLAGIAINSYTADSSKGTWQYSSDGTNWNTISSVSGASTAFSLKGTDQLRFVPAANFNGSVPSLSVTLIDSSATVTSGATVNVSTAGGSTAYSSTSVVLSHSVTSVNDAPVASGSATLTADLEDAATGSLNAATIASLFGSNFSDAVDQVAGGSNANTLAGVAINSYTADASKGTWQYSTDGTNWNAISSVSGASTAFSLKSTDQLRFVPAANFNGAVPSLSVTLIDSSTTVTSGATINVSTAGGSTAYSSASVVLSHSVTAVNDAPVASGSATLTADLEDTATGSLNAATITSLFGSNFSDAADQVTGGSSANTLAGVAINSYTADASKGAWQYSSDGTNWNAISSVSGTSTAFSLKSTDQLRFVPTANFNGSVPSLSVTLIDSSATVTSGATVNVSTAGGSTAYSSASVVLSHSVIAVNDAPVASGSASLAADAEDTVSASLNAPTVLSLFNANFGDAADQVTGGSSANTLAGVAINSYTADASKGAWQYSTDGTNWNAISSVSGTSTAFSLKSTDQLRFVPAANFNGTVPSLSVTLIDSSVTVTSGATINVSTAGGSTAYSSASVVLSHSVTAVNDAPVASGSATLTADAEDTAAASVNKATITTLFGSNFSDVDNTLAGIAINSYTADSSKGTWQYSSDGTNWNTISSVSGASTAFSLKSTDQLRFVPAANFNGSVPSLSVTLIDSSATVTSGATVNVSTAGGSTAYSSTSVILSHSVTSVNDAPVASGSATLSSDLEDTATGSLNAATITSLFGSNFSDVADQVSGGSSANTLAGIAINSYTADSSKGTWQYSTDGTNWNVISSVSGASSAFILKSTDQLRFVPAANFNGAVPSLSVTLIDSSTTVTSGATINVSTAGGSTAYSSASVVLSHSVTAVNDAPIASGSASLAADAEDTVAASINAPTVLSLFNANFSDLADQVAGGSNANTLAGVAINSYTADASKGTWQYSSDGTNWNPISSVSGASTAFSLKSTDQLRFVQAANFNGAVPSLSVTLIDSSTTVTSGAMINVSTTGGSTAYSSASVVLSHSVTAVNDAPVASGSASLAADAEDTVAASLNAPTVLSLFNANFSDVADQVSGGSSANTLAGIAINSYTADASKGTWQYSSDGTNWNAISSVSGASTAFSLKSTDQLRFVPAANFNGAVPSLSVTLIDSSTTVTSGATVNVSTAGGATAYSSASVVLSHSVTSVNDAPVASGSASLAADAEDTVAASLNAPTVLSLFNANFSDAVDQVAGGSSANTLAGIAINSYTADASKGVWQYSSDGTNWNPISSVSGASTAFSLKSTDQLRFVPAANFYGAVPSLSVTLIDSSTTVTSGAMINVSTTGGSTAYSSASVVLSHSVTAVNDAPVASGSASLAADAEDTVAASLNAPTVLSLFNANFSDVADQVSGGSSANTLAGIAINSYTADASKGTWQYSTDGTNWNAISSVSGASSALSLKSTDQLRFVPAAKFNGAVPSLSVTLIDSSVTVTSGATVNVSTAGDSTAYSSASVVLSHSVTAVNDAPVANGNATLISDLEDTAVASLSESTVASLFNASFSDIDNDVLAGVAINSYTADSSKGIWQYSSDGVTWNNINTITNSSHALGLNDSDLLRFIPTANFNGAAPILSVTLIDSSVNVVSGSLMDVSITGDTTPYSSTSIILSHSVSAVNDAPLAGGNAILSSDLEDTIVSSLSESNVAILFGTSFSDIDNDILAGVAINSYTADVSKGTWQYSSDGINWNIITTINNTSSALSLKNTDILRFIPAANFNGAAPSLSVTLIDSSTTVTSGAILNVNVTGGITPFSSGNVILSHSITAVNDAPIASGNATLIADLEDTGAASLNASTVLSLFNANFSDVADQVAGGSSANTLAGIAINSYTADASKGVWQHSSDGTNWSVISSISGANSALSLKNTDQLRFVPTANFNGTVPGLSVTLIDSSTTVISGATINVSATGGTTAYSSASVILNHNVIAVNDAPIASGSTSLITDIENVAIENLHTATISSLFTANFSDIVDQVVGGSNANSLAGVAIVNYSADINKGTWQYSSDGMNWHNISTISSENSALSLKNTDQMRFVPNANFNGAAPDIKVVLIDTSTSITSGTVIDVSNKGGTTAYSNNTVTLTHNVSSINTAPVASGAASSQDGVEDQPISSLSSGTIANIFGGNFNDVDGNLAGIAINNYIADTNKGIWQYSSDGNIWNNIPSITNINSALSIANNDLLRFVPAANFNGNAPTLSVTLIDDSVTVTSGATVNLSNTGGSTAYSRASVVLSHHVNAVNDAPVASGDATLAADLEDSSVVALNTTTVANLFGANFSDTADQVSGGSSANTLAGIAINAYSEDLSKGVWQYSTDGTTWNTIPNSISNNNAIVLKNTDLLRFIPVTNYYGEAPILSVKLIESGGIQVPSGNRIDVAASGGTTTYSQNSVMLHHAISPVDDAPIVSATTINNEYKINSNPIKLFDNVIISTIEQDQHIVSLDITVSNVLDGSAEAITIDGTKINLVAGNSGTTANNHYVFHTLNDNGVIKINIENINSISVNAVNTMLSELRYENLKPFMTGGERIISLARLVDSGTTLNGGVIASNINIVSRVNVIANTPEVKQEVAASPPTPVNVLGTTSPTAQQVFFVGYSALASDLSSDGGVKNAGVGMSRGNVINLGSVAVAKYAYVPNWGWSHAPSFINLTPIVTGLRTTVTGFVANEAVNTASALRNATQFSSGITNIQRFDSTDQSYSTSGVNSPIASLSNTSSQLTSVSLAESDKYNGNEANIDKMSESGLNPRVGTFDKRVKSLLDDVSGLSKRV